jgi:hypothetical protein
MNSVAERIMEDVYRHDTIGHDLAVLVGDQTWRELMSGFDLCATYPADPGGKECLRIAGYEVYRLPCVASSGWIIGRPDDIGKILALYNWMGR